MTSNIEAVSISGCRTMSLAVDGFPELATARFGCIIRRPQRLYSVDTRCSMLLTASRQITLQEGKYHR